MNRALLQSSLHLWVSCLLSGLKSPEDERPLFHRAFKPAFHKPLHFGFTSVLTSEGGFLLRRLEVQSSPCLASVHEGTRGVVYGVQAAAGARGSDL